MPSRAELEEQALGEYEAQINSFATNLLADYHPETAIDKRFTSKELNDPVWGTIHLSAAEVVLLDSPMLQRLRFVKQLGVVHLVYPGATHSRLEHSLGVLHQTTLLLDAMRIALRDVGTGVQVTPELEQLMRLTALCHDLGHGTMSHVSENAIAGDSSVNMLERAFASRMKVEQPRISEIAAYYIIRCPRFQELVTFGWSKTNLAPPPVPVAADFMSKAVIGLPVSEDIPLLHEIITGPFDADKLDYLKRDSLYTGTPNIVDILRLTRKIRVASVPWQTLPEEIARRVQERPNPYAITGIAQSGARTLDELALARALLHDKVYRHHKVRSAETMVASVLTVFGAKLGPVPVLPLRLSDEQFLNLDADQITNLSEGSIDASKAAVAADILHRLKGRDLFVRSFAWEHSPQPVGLASESEQTQALQSLRGSLNRRNERGGVAAEIAAVVDEILTLIDERYRLDGMVVERLRNYIWIDPPTAPKGRSLLSRALLITREGTVRRFRDDFPDTEGWSDQYLVNRDVGYVFAPRSIAVTVYLAAETVFREKFKIRVATDERAASEGIDTSAVKAMRQRLFDAGFYTARPTDLWPMPPELTTALIGQAIKRFLDNASEYSPPSAEESVPEPRTAAAVREFARQFVEPALYEDAVAMLEAVRFFKRHELVASLRAFLNAHTEFHNGYVCPLGSAKDSGGVMSYFANDIAEEFGLRVMAASEVPAGASHVVLIDDFIGSGRQVIDILESWFGLERTYDLGEDRSTTELPGRVVDTLSQAKLGFSFCAGLTDGPNLLSDWLGTHELSNVIEVAHPQGSLPSLPGLANGGQVSQGFVDACAEIGKQLLLSAGYEPQKAEERKLGYGNHGLLVAFPHNVPAHTVTAIWDRGTVDDRTWMPILPRRRKT